MSDTGGNSEPGNDHNRVRTYDRPDPPFFQQHPVIIIVLASLSLIATMFIVFVVL